MGVVTPPRGSLAEKYSSGLITCPHRAWQKVGGTNLSLMPSLPPEGLPWHRHRRTWRELGRELKKGSGRRVGAPGLRAGMGSQNIGGAKRGGRGERGDCSQGWILTKHSSPAKKHEPPVQVWGAETGENRGKGLLVYTLDVILLDIWVMCLSMSKSGITKGPMSLSPSIITATYRALIVHKHFKNLVPHRPYNSPNLEMRKLSLGKPGPLAYSLC